MELLLKMGPMKIDSLVHLSGYGRDSVFDELFALVKERRVYFEAMDDTFWYAEPT